MGLIGLDLDRTNPRFTLTDFLTWMPQFEESFNDKRVKLLFSKLKEKANDRIFKSIYGSDWDLAMCYFIAHYLSLVALESKKTSGPTLENIAGSAQHQGIVTSASVGGFNKSLDFSHSLAEGSDTLFWNKTEYGSSLIALFKTKAVPMVFVITDERFSR